MNNVLKTYRLLLAKYGPQGWWPIGGRYHKGDYSYPKNERQRFEICIGAILAQNISWEGAQKAVISLRGMGAVDAKKLLAIPLPKLKEAIRPAGYFNQKARKLREFSKFYLALESRTPTRKELLSVWGIGQETADSILLYAYRVPSFVVDTYTRRVFGAVGMVRADATYEEIKLFFEDKLSKDADLFNEFHALIVEHAKRMKRK